MSIQDIKDLMVFLDQVHLTLTDKSKIEKVVNLKVKLRKMIWAIEDGEML